MKTNNEENQRTFDGWFASKQFIHGYLFRKFENELNVSPRNPPLNYEQRVQKTKAFNRKFRRSEIIQRCSMIMQP